jgi:hypothetical protein
MRRDNKRKHKAEVFVDASPKVEGIGGGDWLNRTPTTSLQSNQSPYFGKCTHKSFRGAHLAEPVFEFGAFLVITHTVLAIEIWAVDLVRLSTLVHHAPNRAEPLHHASKEVSGMSQRV